MDKATKSHHASLYAQEAMRFYSVPGQSRGFKQCTASETLAKMAVELERAQPAALTPQPRQDSGLHQRGFPRTAGTLNRVGAAIAGRAHLAQVFQALRNLGAAAKEDCGVRIAVPEAFEAKL